MSKPIIYINVGQTIGICGGLYLAWRYLEEYSQREPAKPEHPVADAAKEKAVKVALNVRKRLKDKL